MERDPVCGMNVDPNTAAAKVEYAGKTYYFCAPGCAKRFQQAPEEYLQPTKLQTAASSFVNLRSSSKSSTAAVPTSKAERQSKHEVSVVPTAGDAEHKPVSEVSSSGKKQEAQAMYDELLELIYAHLR
jgi:YHS domain-containing protein